MSADQWVIRLRVRGFHWTSPVMTEAQARGRQQQLSRDVASLAAGTSMLPFRALGGREVDVPARFVIGVELSPWVDREPADQPTGGSVVSLHVDGDPSAPPPSATSWLRQRRETEQRVRLDGAR